MVAATLGMNRRLDHKPERDPRAEHPSELYDLDRPREQIGGQWVKQKRRHHSARCEESCQRRELQPAKGRCGCKKDPARGKCHDSHLPPPPYCCTCSCPSCEQHL